MECATMYAQRLPSMSLTLTLCFDVLCADVLAMAKVAECSVDWHKH